MKEPFSSAQVVRLTGINWPVLHAWINADFFRPGWDGPGKAPHYQRRAYRFRDVVTLRVLALMRESGIERLATLAPVRDFLQEREGLDSLPECAWLWYDGKSHVELIRQPVSGARFSLLIDLSTLVADLKRDIEES